MPLRILLSVLVLIGLSIGCSNQMSKSFLRREDIRYLPDSASTKGIARAGLCRQSENYIPDTTRPLLYPTYYYKINIHLVNNEDSTANFNREEGIEYARTIVGAANWRLRNNIQMKLRVGYETRVLPPFYQYLIWPDTSVP